METLKQSGAKVSVIIGAYNYGHFIERATESVLGQSYPEQDREIIIVDDGSTDDTLKRIKQYGKKVRYFFQKNKGQAAALNFGIEKAEGGIIAFLDADDLWRSGKLSAVMEEFDEDRKVDAVYHYMNYVDEEEELVGTCPDIRLQHKICKEAYDLENYLKGFLTFFPPTSGISVRTECLKKIGPIPDEFRICADGYLQLMIPFHARKFKLLKKYLADLRLHGGNLWSGRPMTSEIVRTQVNVQKQLLKHLDRFAKGLKIDIGLLEKNMRAILDEREIRLDDLEGRKLAALKKAIFLEEYPLQGGAFYRIFRKLSLLLSLLIPFSFYEWLRKKYRMSFLFASMHGLRS